MTKLITCFASITKSKLIPCFDSITKSKLIPCFDSITRTKLQILIKLANTQHTQRHVYCVCPHGCVAIRGVASSLSACMTIPTSSKILSILLSATLLWSTYGCLLMVSLTTLSASRQQSSSKHLHFCHLLLHLLNLTTPPQHTITSENY